ADLCLISPSRLAHWASKGQLQAIPSPYLSSDGSYNWLDLLPLYRNKLLVWERKVYGLPLNGDASLCFFRDDLFRDDANQSAFQGQYSRRLAAPNTWEEFAEIAEFFNGKPRPAISRPVPSLPPLSDKQDGIDREFFTIAAPMARRAVREDDRNQPADDELFSFHYDLKTGQNRIANPAFTEAFRMMQRLQACRPEAPVENPPDEFRKGRAVLCIAPAEWVGRFQVDGSLVKGRFEICRIPGSRRIFDYETGQAQELAEPNFVPYQGAGGWLGVVPQGAKNPEAAFAFLAELTGPKISGEIFLNPTVGCGPTRREHFGLLTRANAFELGVARTNALAEVLRRSLYPPPINPVVRLRTPDEREHQRILCAELRLALQEKNRDPQKVMSTVAQRWQELDERKSPTERRIQYRLSLGLPGAG
ncbi:MAG TPA: extracellular solute-binding protein, partial [Gemmataceae bacterium]|nr:extracellular solute-binding protein [Gemmataceae bacterium]